MIYLFFIIFSASSTESTIAKFECTKIQSELDKICPKIPQKGQCSFLENTSQEQKIRIAQDLIEVKKKLGLMFDSKIKQNMTLKDFAFIIVEVAQCVQPRNRFWRAVIADKANPELAKVFKEDIKLSNFSQGLLGSMVDNSLLRQAIKNGFIEVQNKEALEQIKEIGKVLSRDGREMLERQQKRMESLSLFQKSQLYLKWVLRKLAGDDFDTLSLFNEAYLYEDLKTELAVSNLARQQMISILAE